MGDMAHPALQPRVAATPPALPADLGAAAGEQAVLAAIVACRPRVWLRRIPGRETFRWPGAAAVAKRFAGDDLKELAYDLVRRGTLRTPARRELDNLRALAAEGFAVPAAIGAFEERGGALRRRSALLMGWVEHEGTLRERAERWPRETTARWLAPLAGLAARLHAAGWYHRDLYLQHVVVAGGELCLLDVGRARKERAPRERWIVKDVAALLCSCPPVVPRRAQLRFLARYLDLRGLRERGERRRFARAVGRKARRLAAHAPRFVDPADQEGA